MIRALCADALTKTSYVLTGHMGDRPNLCYTSVKYCYIKLDDNTFEVWKANAEK